MLSNRLRHRRRRGYEEGAKEREVVGDKRKSLSIDNDHYPLIELGERREREREGRKGEKKTKRRGVKG